MCIRDRCGHGAGRQLQVIQLCVLDALVVQLQPNAVVIQMSRGHRSHFLPVRTVVHNDLEPFFQNTHTCFNKQYYLVLLQKKHPMGCEAQLASKCLFSIHARFLRRAILTRKVGQTELFFACHQGSLVGLCMQDYKSLCAAVTICSLLTNIKTHIQYFDQLI